MGSFFCGEGYLKGYGWFQVACGYGELASIDARRSLSCIENNLIRHSLFNTGDLGSGDF